MGPELGWSKPDLYLAATIGLGVSGLAAYPVGAAIDRGYGRLIMGLGALGGRGAAGRLVAGGQPRAVLCPVHRHRRGPGGHPLRCRLRLGDAPGGAGPGAPRHHLGDPLGGLCQHRLRAADPVHARSSWLARYPHRARRDQCGDLGQPLLQCDPSGEGHAARCPGGRRTAADAGPPRRRLGRAAAGLLAAGAVLRGLFRLLLGLHLPHLPAAAGTRHAHRCGGDGDDGDRPGPGAGPDHRLDPGADGVGAGGRFADRRALPAQPGGLRDPCRPTSSCWASPPCSGARRTASSPSSAALPCRSC